MLGMYAWKPRKFSWPSSKWSCSLPPSSESTPALLRLQVPALDAGRVAALDAAERMRLEAEREAALKQEAERKKVMPAMRACY
jgi:hypothetical protein